MDELTRLLRESFEYSMTNVHTAFPGVVVKYDKDKRRADIQPSIKRRLPSGEFADFPMIPDVPVLFSGTKQYTVCYPLEKDDEVLCVFMERGTDAWRDAGGSGIEEGDPRRFNLMDCVAVPGLQPVEFIGAEGDGFCVVHKSKPDGELVSSITMDDEKLSLTHKELKFTVKGDKISFKNGKKDFYTVMSKILHRRHKGNRGVHLLAGREEKVRFCRQSVDNRLQITPIYSSARIDRGFLFYCKRKRAGPAESARGWKAPANTVASRCTRPTP